MDYPGFGLSDGLHGYIPSFETLVDDVIEHYSKVKGMIATFRKCWFCCCDSLTLVMVLGAFGWSWISLFLGIVCLLCAHLF